MGMLQKISKLLLDLFHSFTDFIEGDFFYIFFRIVDDGFQIDYDIQQMPAQAFDLLGKLPILLPYSHF